MSAQVLWGFWGCSSISVLVNLDAGKKPEKGDEVNGQKEGTFCGNRSLRVGRLRQA